MFFNKVNPYFNESMASQIKTIQQDTYERNVATIKNYAATSTENTGKKNE